MKQVDEEINDGEINGQSISQSQIYVSEHLLLDRPIPLYSVFNAWFIWSQCEVMYTEPVWDDMANIHCYPAVAYLA